MREAYGKKSDKERDRFRLVNHGSGGYRDPKERQRELIVYDTKQGYVSPAAAERDYGYKEG